MEIFRIFLTKLPESFSDKYLRKMRNDTPSLSIYLGYLDDAVATVRTRRLWLPLREIEERRFTFDRGQIRDRRTFAPRPTAFRRQWVNHAHWGDYDQDQNQGAESQYYVEEVETDEEDNAIEWHRRPQLTAYACSQESGSVSPQQLGHARLPRPLGAPPQPLANQLLHAIAWNDEERERSSKADVPYDRPIRFPCLTCGAPDHSRLCCEDVSLEEKQSLVRMFRLCCLCLKRGHFSATCTSRLRCAHCGGRHHTQLCVYSYPPREGNPSRPPHQQVDAVKNERKEKEISRALPSTAVFVIPPTRP